MQAMVTKRKDKTHRKPNLQRVFCFKVGSMNIILYLTVLSQSNPNLTICMLVNYLFPALSYSFSLCNTTSQQIKRLNLQSVVFLGINCLIPPPPKKKIRKKTWHSFL